MVELIVILGISGLLGASAFLADYIVSPLCEALGIYERFGI